MTNADKLSTGQPVRPSFFSREVKLHRIVIALASVWLLDVAIEYLTGVSLTWELFRIFNGAMQLLSV